MMTPEERFQRAQQIARQMIDEGWRETMSYSVLTDGREPPFTVHWQDRNAFGVKFNVKQQRAEAEDWIITALLAGFTVFHSQNGGARGYQVYSLCASPGRARLSDWQGL
jgi:hypothetical protein